MMCSVAVWGAGGEKPASVWDACGNVASAYNTVYMYDMSTLGWCIKLACFDGRDAQSPGSMYV